jgi:hypothetical protein
MYRGLSLGKTRAGIVGVVVGAALTGGVAYATIPDSAGSIHACYLNQSGNLRVIDTTSGGACRPDETPLTWSQGGSAGGPLAFAHVANGVLDAARSKNVVSVTRKLDSNGFTFVYCFVLTATPVNVVATPEKDDGGFTSPFATVSGTAGMSSSPCDAGTSAAVYYGGPPPMPDRPPAASFFVTFN